jgi:hypothetical protein
MTWCQTGSQFTVKCGVPQGSILGPFILYINDIVNVQDTLVPLLFADNTTIFMRGKSVKDTTEKYA